MEQTLSVVNRGKSKHLNDNNMEIRFQKELLIDVSQKEMPVNVFIAVFWR